MKIRYVVTVALVLVGLAGCITPPTPEEIKSAHYGSYPSGYLAKLDPVLDELHQGCGDPFQVLSISRPHKDWIGDGTGRLWAYSVLVDFKAPNGGPGGPPIIFRNKYYFVNGNIKTYVVVPNWGDLVGATNGETIDANYQYPLGGNFQN
jgi:hypothetical protein